MHAFIHGWLRVRDSSGTSRINDSFTPFEQTCCFSADYPWVLEIVKTVDEVAMAF